MTNFGSLKIFAVVRSPEVGDALVSAINPANGTKLDVRVGQLKALGPHVMSGERPDVLLVDIDADDPADMDVLNQIRLDKALAKTPVVVTSNEIGSAGIRRLLRDGVADFIPQPLIQSEVLDALQSAIEKMRQAQPTNPESGRVFSFLRACGGMGATTLAVHGALSLMRREKATKKDVCLIDLDPQFGNVALFLDLEQGPGFLDIVRSPERLDGNLLRGAVAKHKSGLDVLTAPAMPVPLDALTPEVIGQLLDVARQEYGYVVVDLPHVLTRWTDTVLTASDIVLLVTQLTVPAIRQTRRLLDLLQEEGHYSLPIRLVLTRYRKRWSGRVNLKNAESALNRKIEFVIPNDYALVIDALNQGVNLDDVKRRSKLGKSIDDMTGSLLEQLESDGNSDTRVIAS
jgi:pilus assembly protein CpaE